MNGNMSDLSGLIELMIKEKRLGKTDLLLLLILIVYGPHTVAELSEKTEYTKGWIYSVLRWVKKFGYIENISSGRPARYSYCGC